MFNDAMGRDRLIGMIQPRDRTDGAPGGDIPLYDIGCVGKVTSFTENDDGRYMITLTGISRFHVEEELPLVNGYRRVRPCWKAFENDLTPSDAVSYDRQKLKDLLKSYFDKQLMQCDWNAFDEAPDEKVINCLSMICPLTPCEKQALMEAKTCCDRASILITIIDMALKDENSCQGHH